MSQLSDTITAESSDQQRLLAERLRRLRKASGLSLRQLADATGTSASFLSQLERGLTGASTSTLIRIANAFGCSIAELFAGTDSAQNPVLRRRDRPTLPEMSGHRKALLSRRPLTQFEAYISEFEPGGSTGDEAYSHGDSHEMILVLAGQVQIDLGPLSYQLDEGDSIEFQSSVPHRVANSGTGPASVLFVTSPPTSTTGYLDTFRAGHSEKSGDDRAQAIARAERQ
ncbi:helix-turn-helix domain-containing protein [Pseudogemmobacter bohemicus]|uniref:helix-turn-helix domain-containing protein n=1 Tax=Pseudogemmobacter bohemicus TaxID=2250708 RepID=UPI0018E4FD1A|nr:XRE family transcriptional regulator [Pseudogemmobacter bohemicus]